MPTALDWGRANTITKPRMKLTMYAPSRQPSINRFALVESSITITAANSVGLNAALTASARMPPTGRVLPSSWSGR